MSEIAVQMKEIDHNDGKGARSALIDKAGNVYCYQAFMANGRQKQVGYIEEGVFKTGRRPSCAPSVTLPNSKAERTMPATTLENVKLELAKRVDTPVEYCEKCKKRGGVRECGIEEGRHLCRFCVSVWEKYLIEEPKRQARAEAAGRIMKAKEEARKKRVLPPDWELVFDSAEEAMRFAFAHARRGIPSTQMDRQEVAARRYILERIIKKKQMLTRPRVGNRMMAARR